jgi:transcriptional regulator with PAS, ATPase and Fis domain
MSVAPRSTVAAERTANLRIDVAPRRIVGSSPAMAAVLDAVDRYAPTAVRVLILGESGVGKELIAEELHRLSRRAAGPFVIVNSAGLTETLLESELFGHVKGSFTGAYRDKAGKFELAHRGTLFLDEIGEMSLRMQGLLLRVLETGEIQKVGAHGGIARVDVRLLAATHRDLPAMVASGAFREDLYYRLNVLQLNVPPLRERRGDIRELADHFLERWTRETGTHRRFSESVYEAFEASSWPGNIRQLENVILRVLIHSTREEIMAADLGDIGSSTPATSAIVCPAEERRRAVPDALYARIRGGGGNFWDVVYTPFMRRELTRRDVREVVRRGLEDARGHYTGVAKLLHLPATDYKRFLNFLRKHECLLDYRAFR